MYTVSVTNNTIQLEKMITQRERLKIEINNIYIRINEFSIENNIQIQHILYSVEARVPPRGAAAFLREVLPAAPRGGTRR